LVKKAVQNDPIFSGLENDVYVHDGKVIRVPKLEEYNLLMQREFEISKVLNKA